MSTEKVKSILNNVFLALQLGLTLWQFMKFTLFGVLIQGVIGYLMRPFRLSTAYSRLQGYDGRIFKRANCYVLQADIPAERTIGSYEVDRIILHYFGSESVLERRGSDKNMLFNNGKMHYYIIPTVWKELQTLGHVLSIAVSAEDDTVAAAAAAASRSAAARADSTRATVYYSDLAAARVAVYDRDLAADRGHTVGSPTAAAARRATAADARRVIAALRAADDAAANAAAAAVAADAAINDASASNAAVRIPAVFVKCWREIWEEVITGEVMPLEEILDGVILYNQRVSVRLNDDWLLPINSSVSEQKLPRILNLVGLFLQAKKVQVHWFLPTLLSIISALLEFTRLRVWFYATINVVFRCTVHSICDQLSYSRRKWMYSLVNWVENLKPSNDIELKVVKDDISAVITEGAKVQKEGAVRVNWLHLGEQETNIIIGKDSTQITVVVKCSEAHHREEKTQMTVHFCRLGEEPIYIQCKFDATNGMCVTRAVKGVGPAVKIGEINVNCSKDQFIKMVTFIFNMAKSSWGSLKCYGPNDTVHIRGFKESVLHYAEIDFPPVYVLKLENAVIN